MTRQSLCCVSPGHQLDDGSLSHGTNPGQDGSDGQNAGSGGAIGGRIRYTIDDVDVRAAIERSQYLDADGKLVTEDYRILLKDQIKKALRQEFASLDDFLRRWTEADRKQAVIDELGEQGISLETLREAVPQGDTIDAFDLVAHIAFDQPPLSRKERANNVKKRNYFGKYGDDARAVLEALLDKYADHGITNIAKIRRSWSCHRSIKWAARPGFAEVSSADRKSIPKPSRSSSNKFIETGPETDSREHSDDINPVT